ncbi:MAG: tetratricopeptide repeat protein [Candidatus Cryptobacteroides sp.]
MKKIYMLLPLLAIGFTAGAQTEKYVQRYNTIVSKLGPAGVGVETLLDNWEAADSTDARVHLARFDFWLTKSRTDEVVKKTEKKYLGMTPLLSLKDSTGVDIYYYQEPFYDDQMYGNAIKSIDKAISLEPDNLGFRFVKANAYISYEKGSPDMALVFLQNLANSSARVEWKYEGKDLGQDFFPEAMQEYCYSFYSLGTPAGMEAFRSLSETMASLYPENPEFLNNIGAYYLVGRNDSKKALKQYSKVLKKFPMDYTAVKNCAIIARRDKNVKLEIKYLQMLVQCAPENEREAAKARLSALEAGK